MLEGDKRNKEGRLSVRTSIIVWLSGAVLGWVVAVLAVYSILRAPDRSITGANHGAATEQAIKSPTDGGNPANLSTIEPAAGPGTKARAAEPAKSTIKKEKP